MTKDHRREMRVPAGRATPAREAASLRGRGMSNRGWLADTVLLLVDLGRGRNRMGRQDLSTFRGLAACSGFSYGDALGAGSGWVD